MTNPRPPIAIPLDPTEALQRRAVEDAGTSVEQTEPNPVHGPEPRSIDGILVRNLYGKMLLHREHDLYVAEAHLGQELQGMIRDQLLAERFSDEDAREWAYRNWLQWLPLPTTVRRRDRDSYLADQVVQAARMYRETGMPVDEAFGWTIRSISAPYATSMRNRGWNPDSYTDLVNLCLARNSEPADPDETDLWIAAPIPAWRALRYLKAGLTCSEAVNYEQRRMSGEDIDPAIDTLIALLQQH